MWFSNIRKHLGCIYSKVRPCLYIDNLAFIPGTNYGSLNATISDSWAQSHEWTLSINGMGTFQKQRNLNTYLEPTVI